MIPYIPDALANIKTQFELAGLVFSVCSNDWLHVRDKDGRQENIFSYETIVAFIKTARNRLFGNNSSIDVWFLDKDNKTLFVEFNRHGQYQFAIQSSDGYRLHLSLGEMNMLITKLQDIWNL